MFAHIHVPKIGNVAQTVKGMVDSRLYTRHGRSRMMVEAHGNEDLGMDTVPRAISAIAGRRIISPKRINIQMSGYFRRGRSLNVIVPVNCIKNL